MSTYLGVIGTDGKIRNVSDSDGLPMKSTDKSVKEIIGHNAVAITDTSNRDVTVDVSALGGRKMIHVQNVLNQSVSISVYVKTSQGLASIVAGSPVTVAANDTRKLIKGTDIAELIEPLQQIVIRASCSVAPTSGALSTWVEGVQA